MDSITLAILPVFITILMGYGCKRLKFPSEAFWESSERFIYFFLLPCLFFETTATSDIRSGNILTVPLMAGGAIVIISAALIALRPILSKNGPSFTSVFQGVIRFNSYIGLALVGPLFGAEGLVIMAVSIGLLVPLINVLSVLVLSIYGSQKTIHWKTIGYRIITNPLVLSSGGGLLFNFLGLELPRLSQDIFKIVGQAALPMGLLTVGAGLRLAELKHAGHLVAFASIGKLLALPLLGHALCTWFGVEGPAYTITLLFCALPSATSSYILARQMGGNKELMAAIIAVETLASAFTIPLVIVLLSI
jgi:malonate transporter